MESYVLAIDQGTTSSRAIVFDSNRRVRAIAQEEFTQHYPRSGWVEHDPEALVATTIATCRKAIAEAGVAPSQIAGIGITNQRETTILWDRQTGKAIHRAIVWQDRRTAGLCAQLKTAGHEPMAAQKTGLLLDPYFSATKIAWLLDHVDGAREAAQAGRLAFGTVDSFLLWRLTGGKAHATDITNASRTLLFDIHQKRFSDELLDLFHVPKSLLPEVHDCAADFGATDPAIFGAAIPILGVAGDQQAAGIGQACFSPGMVKATYGTGCFALLNIGAKPIASNNRLLTTIAYALNGHVAYALEGSIFAAGATIQWLRDGLGMIDSAADSGALAAAADDNQDIYLVPAFAGLGAPYWDAECRGAIFGLSRGTGRKELARAALEAVCFQTRDLIDAMHADWKSENDTVLRVDGGMVASDWTMQRLADLLGAPVDRPRVMETTALGAAYLAGYQAGLYADPETFAQEWSLDRSFAPYMSAAERARRYDGWRNAVARTLTAPR